MFERILVCLDGSVLAAQIMPYAQEQAVRFGSRVVLLRVVNLPSALAAPGIPGQPTTPVPPPRFMLEGVEREEGEAIAYLERAAQPLRQAGLDVECVAIQGAPREVIVQYADENEIDLIALATHGRSGLGRVVFGSVADHVLRESGRPILLIKPRPQRD